MKQLILAPLWGLIFIIIFPFLGLIAIADIIIDHFRSPKNEETGPNPFVSNPSDE